MFFVRNDHDEKIQKFMYSRNTEFFINVPSILFRNQNASVTNAENTFLEKKNM